MHLASKEMQWKKVIVFFSRCFALVCKCARIVWLGIFIHSFVQWLAKQIEATTMHLYHVNWYSHSMQNRLFCGRWCVVWIMNCFVSIVHPRTFCAHTHHAHNMPIASGLWCGCNASVIRGSLMMQFCCKRARARSRTSTSFSRLHYSWRPNASKVYSTRSHLCAHALARDLHFSGFYLFLLQFYFFFYCCRCCCGCCFNFNLPLIRCAHSLAHWWYLHTEIDLAWMKSM